MPNLVAIAGPNGAGKSTAAPLLIGKRLRIAEFVNAGVIAAGLSAFAPEKGNPGRQADAEAVGRTCRCGERLCVFETTLASRHFAHWIGKLRAERGYRFHLFFLWLPDAEQSVRRVAGRVRHGGHSVPLDVIRRRYESGLRNFFELYSPIADSWELHENTTRQPRLIASREGANPVAIGDKALWDLIRNQMSAREKDSEYHAGAEPKVMGVPVSEVMEIFAQAGREAYARHKALGIPVVIWRDGKVVEIPPSEIEV